MISEPLNPKARKSYNEFNVPQPYNQKKKNKKNQKQNQNIKQESIIES